MRKGAATLTFGLVVIFTLTLSVRFDHSRSIDSFDRTPASLGKACHELFASLVKKQTFLSKTWSKLKGLKPTYPFDFNKFSKLRSEYVTELNGAENFSHFRPDSSPEGVVAFMEAMKKNLEGVDTPDIEKMGFFKRRKVTKLVKQMNSEGPVRLNTIEDLVGELSVSLYGNSLKTHEIALDEVATKKILARVALDDMATQGFKNAFPKYKISDLNPHWLLKFTQSKKGKALGAVVFNLGSIVGFPPLYLPGLKPLKVPAELVEELLAEGLTDDMMKKLGTKLLGDIRRSSEVHGSFELRERYRILLRYYKVGLGIYLTYAIVANMSETKEEMDEQEEMLDNTIEDALEKTSGKHELEEKGYDLTSEDITSMPNPFCDAIKMCLKSFVKDDGEVPEKGSPEYKECKEGMDTMNKCPEM